MSNISNDAITMKLNLASFESANSVSIEFRNSTELGEGCAEDSLLCFVLCYKTSFAIIRTGNSALIPFVE